MTIIICLDERGGMTFLGKRQSRDEAVCRDILDTVDSNRLLLSEYSLPLFKEAAVTVVKDPLSAAGEEDFCFVEKDDITGYLSKAKALIVYKWNRHYPADKRPELAPEDHGFELIKSVEFSGRSHDKITKEIYTK